MYPIYFSLSLDRQSYLSRDESNRINGLTKDGLFCSDTVSVIPILNTHNRDGFSYFDLGGWKNIWGGAFSSKLIQLRLNSIYNSEFRYN